LWRDIVHAGLIYSLPLITIGAASAFGWMLAYLRGPMVYPGGSSTLPGMIPISSCSAWSPFSRWSATSSSRSDHCHLHADRQSAHRGGSINPIHMGVVLIVTLAFG